MSVFAVRADLVDRLWDAARAVLAHSPARFAVVCGLDRGPNERRYVPFGVRMAPGSGESGWVDDWELGNAQAWARELEAEVWWCASDDYGSARLSRVRPDGEVRVFDVDTARVPSPSDEPHEHPDDPYYGLVRVEVGDDDDDEELEEGDDAVDEEVVRMARSLAQWERSGPSILDVEIPLAGDGRPKVSVVHGVFRAVAAAMRASTPEAIGAAMRALDAASEAGDLDEVVANVLRNAVRSASRHSG